jgi:hypothetical protein
MSRKPHSRSQLQRRKPSLEPRKRILIVCEGEKTEPIYFNYLKRILRLSSAEICIIGKDCGSDPNSVVGCAIERIQNSKDPYDEAWCLIDTEVPPRLNLNDAYNRATLSYKPPRGIQTNLRIILSNPCFEFWYILHFNRTSQTFTSNKKVYSLLKQYIPGYSKSDKNVPERVYEKTKDAVRNSELVLRQQHQDCTNLRNCNPSTHVHKVVQYLFDMVKVPIPGCT